MGPEGGRRKIVAPEKANATGMPGAYGAFLVSKFKPPIQTFDPSIQIWNCLVQTFDPSISTFNPSVQIRNGSIQAYDPSIQI